MTGDGLKDRAVSHSFRFGIGFKNLYSYLWTKTKVNDARSHGLITGSFLVYMSLSFRSVPLLSYVYICFFGKAVERTGKLMY